MAVAHAWPYSSHVWVQVYWNNQDCWPVQQKQWISILAEFWSFFNVDNSTNLRHMWSGPPMSPSPMSLIGRVGQILGLSSSKPNRFLDLFFVSTFPGWARCHSPPWTVHRCRERLWRPPLLAAQVSRVFLGSKIHSGRGKESWEPVTQSSWLEWGPGTSNCSQGEPISLLTNIPCQHLPDFRVCSSTKAALS